MRIGPIMTAILVLIPASHVEAIGDVAGWAIFGRQAVQMTKTAQQAEKRYQQIQSQMSTLKQMKSDSEGSYGWGNWNNSLSDLKQQHEWAPSDWTSALHGMSGGNPQRYQQLLSQYKENHSSMTTSNYAKGKDSNLSASYKNQVDTNQASAASATYEFNDINKHLKALYQLGQEIENTSKNNNLKSAMDLNSRVELEIAYISTEELRMQTLLNQQTAQLQSSKIALDNEASQYNQAGESK
jgi:type IV secretion system protein VirB5